MDFLLHAPTEFYSKYITLKKYSDAVDGVFGTVKCALMA